MYDEWSPKEKQPAHGAEWGLEPAQQPQGLVEDGEVEGVDGEPSVLGDHPDPEHDGEKHSGSTDADAYPIDGSFRYFGRGAGFGRHLDRLQRGRETVLRIT